MSELSISNLKVSYGKDEIIKNFNLNLANGELLVILGSSGCGKSTLLSAISGLLKPKYGDIILGNNILFSVDNKINVQVEKRNIGFVFQNYSLWPHMNVFENIAYPLRIKKLKKALIKEEVVNILKSVELSDKANCYESQLSGGEKQRVALARAVVSKPELLLLDEPLANIDAVLKHQILNLISRINKEYSLPMIYVTHDQNESFLVADRIVIMKEGEIVQKGSPKQIYRHPKNEFVAEFIGRNNIIHSGMYGNITDITKGNTIAVRPEDIYIHSSGEFTGEIKRVIYRGFISELYVDFNNQTIIISVNSDEYKQGDIVKFNIGKYHVLDRSV
ncbi:ABC transporter ATP-binding protein [Clostridiaceae bacterium M8S5]|nr:ABC transporter ATP-binding protein [Clostridiaceae bacterium M8S5]